MLKRNTTGFTLMELVVTVAIIGTLAAFAVPAYLDAQQNGKANKALETMNTIGSAIVNKYTSVAHYGIGNSALAQLNTTASSWTELLDGTVLIKYDRGNGVEQVTTIDLFKDGVPKSPFGSGWEFYVHDDSTGEASWSGNPPELLITKVPMFKIRDKNQPLVFAEYTL